MDSFLPGVGSRVSASGRGHLIVPLFVRGESDPRGPQISSSHFLRSYPSGRIALHLGIFWLMLLSLIELIHSVLCPTLTAKS